jgi:small subunit ribosomal protein S20
MPITKSAKQALKVSLKRRAMNDRNKKAVKESVKAVEKNPKASDSKQTLSKAFSALDKAVKRGVMKKNTASRKKSQLSKKVG